MYGPLLLLVNPFSNKLTDLKPASHSMSISEPSAGRKDSGRGRPAVGSSVACCLPFSKHSGRYHERGHVTERRVAHADVTAVREAYERELLAAGAGELIRGAVSDATGKLRLEGVPAGEWLLLGWREESHAVKAARTPAKDAGHFAAPPTMTGYGAVSYWRIRVSLRAGETTEVSLSDRSVWLTAVREEFTYPDEGVKKPGSSKKRR